MPENNKKRILAFMVCCAPFFLNDLANIFLYRNYMAWLAVDYVFVKAFLLGFIFYLLRKKIITFEDLGLKAIKLPEFLFWTVLMIIAGLFLDQIGGRFWASVIPGTALGKFPVIANPALYRLDLYLGLFFVGFTEEIIFRGLAFRVLYENFKSLPKVFIISSLIFGLIHWSLGINVIINTAIIGAVFMIALWRTKSVWPLIIAHFIVDYVAFSGLIPEKGLTRILH